MAVLDIVYYPNKVLTTPTKPVEEVNDEIRTIVKNMIDSMYHYKGIGIAAPQLGIPLQITVMDITPSDEPPDVKVLINPKILETSKETHTYEEGCLSFPDVYGDVTRPKTCVVEALNENGELVRYEAEGLLATCMQHEIDHLQGILFIDHMSRLKRKLAVKKLATIVKRIKQKKEKETQAAL